MKKLLSFIYFLVCVHFAFAQRGMEVSLPPGQNFELQKQVLLQQETAVHNQRHFILGKTVTADTSFPFVDRFTSNAANFDQDNWVDDYAKKTGHTAVFDAHDQFGTVYPGIFGQADILTSQQ